MPIETFWVAINNFYVRRVMLLFLLWYTEDYDGESTVLTFSPGVLRTGVPVTINNDQVVEGNETFFGSLDHLGQPVRTDPSQASVMITEDASDSEFMNNLRL